VPNLRDFERRLGGLVEGLFSKTFRSGVQPIEIAKRVVRAMDDGKQVAINEVWAPNHFEISLSEDDAPRFQQMESALAAELNQLILETAAERGWGLVGPPEVELFVGHDLRKGDLEVEASLVQGEQKVEPAAVVQAAAAGQRAELVVHTGDDVRRVALDKEVLTIGRLPGSDVVVDDKGVSRRHAQIRTKDGASTLTDLGSTNGTNLNGKPVQSRPLNDGDRITVGTTVIEYRRV
jgi:FhaA, N-terminal domain/FHA domain